METLDSVEVEYVSQIHLAAKASRISALDGWIQRLAQAANALPGILDNADPDAIAAEYADMTGVPARVRAPAEAVAAARAERARQAQMQQEAAVMQQLGQAAKIGGVPVDENHLGGAIMRGMQGDATGGML